MRNKQNIEAIQLRQAMYEKSLQELIDDKLFILTPSETNQNWNKILEATKQRIKYLFETDDLKEQAKALILGASAPVYLKMFQIERAKRKELENKLNSLVKSNKAGRQTAVQPSVKKPTTDVNAMIEEIFNKYAK